MSQAEFRNTYSWHGALDLGPELVSLAEDLPLHEQTGMVMQISELMIDLPAMVAADLVDGTSLRFAPYYRLIAALELIERVYPALDAGQAKSALEELGNRLASASFTETLPAPTIVLPSTLDQPDNETAAEPAPAEPAPAEPSATDPAATNLVPPPTQSTDQATPVHVQPDSL